MTPQPATVLVSLYLKGLDLEPGRVTQDLNVCPSVAKKRGDSTPSSAGQCVVSQTGVWAITWKNEVADLSEPLDSLVSALSHVEDIGKRFPSASEAYLDIFIAVDSDEHRNASCSINISEEQLRRLCKLGVPLNITFSSGEP